ncbi:Hypothetical protein FKW44_018543 [Caligus rogercresseyi]|uniref:Uncharacterized protein n=1 Tax=Caligus rogercresseyi TaxID=217165 RepID=A0A7T8JY28_CALRO|nr:Hypothetical protein FKW44_018543 [Caligus rogercresseyi]
MYNLETPAGQIFCGNHTTLGFSSAMNKVMRLVEADMKMEQGATEFHGGPGCRQQECQCAGQPLDMCLNSVKKTYTEEVLNSVSDVAAEHLDEVKKLTDLMLPHLKTVLARQRRDYGIDEETFPMVYLVSEQASNIDGTPVHNIGMERQCGKVDYRLKKLGTLNAVSRSIIFQKSQELRNGQVPSFRGFKAAAQAKKEVELNWTERMKEKI